MVFETVRDAIAQQLEMDPATITMDSKLTEDLKTDSVDVIEIVMNLESEFGLEFAFDDPVSYTHLDVYKRQALWAAG